MAVSIVVISLAECRQFGCFLAVDLDRADPGEVLLDQFTQSRQIFLLTALLMLATAAATTTGTSSSMNVGPSPSPDPLRGVRDLVYERERQLLLSVAIGGGTLAISSVADAQPRLLG